MGTRSGASSTRSRIPQTRQQQSAQSIGLASALAPAYGAAQDCGMASRVEERRRHGSDHDDADTRVRRGTELDTLEILPTPLTGLTVVRRTRFEDSRGFLERIYSAAAFEAAGVRRPVAQINHTL